jgi:hypothetical protein
MQLAPIGAEFGLSDRWIYRIPVQMFCLRADGPFPSRIYRIPVQRPHRGVIAPFRIAGYIGFRCS